MLLVLSAQQHFFFPGDKNLQGQVEEIELIGVTRNKEFGVRGGLMGP